MPHQRARVTGRTHTIDYQSAGGTVKFFRGFLPPNLHFSLGRPPNDSPFQRFQPCEQFNRHTPPTHESAPRGAGRHPEDRDCTNGLERPASRPYHEF
jgi:hypothetical protein